MFIALSSDSKIRRWSDASLAIWGPRIILNPHGSILEGLGPAFDFSANESVCSNNFYQSFVSRVAKNKLETVVMKEQNGTKVINNLWVLF